MSMNTTERPTVRADALQKLRDALGLQEADETIAMLNAAVRIDRLTTDVAELKAQLAPYLAAEARAERWAATKQRAEQIAAFLFPTYYAAAARKDASLYPPKWHEKSWWWNGVSVEWDDSDFDLDGGKVRLCSYVGGGEVENIDLPIPKDWIEAADDQWRDLVTSFRDQKVIERVQAKAAKEAAEAQRQIAAAQATLKRLGAA